MDRRATVPYSGRQAVTRGCAKNGQVIVESAAYGLRPRASVKRTVTFLFAIFVTIQPLFAQKTAEELRKEYEKEKNGPHGECGTKWTTLQRGLQHRSITCLGDEDDLDLHVV